MTPIVGIHAVTAALEAGRGLERVLAARGAGGGRLHELVEACRRAGVPVRFEAREQLDRLARGAVHQGVVALAAERSFAELSDIVERAPADAVMVVTDGVEDPHNLGAIIRSAEAAGAVAVVVPERRSAPLTETVAKAAAGALDLLPIARVKNIARALEELKRAGFWIHGLDERGDKSIFDVDLRGRCAFVLGGEGRGLHRLTAEKCDFLVRIPLLGRTPSLNVSVAAGVILFEALRRRMSDA